VAFVRENRLDTGLAFDGDGDRMLCVDDKGEAADGDVIMAVCALALKERGLLANDTLVATVMSNVGLELMCERNGIQLLRAPVGDRYVIEAMRKGGHNLGGEQSGHIIFHDRNTTGDGILTGVMLLSTLTDSGKRLSELRKVIETYPQVLVNARMDNRYRHTYMENENAARAIGEAEAALAGRGRVLVRPSGTEPLIRVMLEGSDKREIEDMARGLAELLERELGE
jgi:phosphoglucosamine mutase